MDASGGEALYQSSFGFGSLLAESNLSFSSLSSPTVEAWINTLSTSGYVLSSQGGAYSVLIGSAGLSAGDIGAIFNTVLVDCGRRVDDGDWHHVAALDDGANLSFYLDGALCGSTPAPASLPAPGTLDVGVNIDGSGAFNGVIDEVRIVDHPLGAAEILRDATFGVPYAAAFSTNAGRSFQLVTSTYPVTSTSPYVSVSGADGATSPQALQICNLTLTQSTNTKTGSQGTNQMVFVASDRAGNLAKFGPFTILVDSLIGQPTAYYPAPGSWVNRLSPTLTWAEANALPRHEVLLSRDNFLTLVMDSTTANSDILLSGYPTRLTLAQGGTYEWKVRATGLTGNKSLYSAANQFTVDAVAPTAAGFRTYSSTGALLWSFVAAMPTTAWPAVAV